jgi:hypothetical protein
VLSIKPLAALPVLAEADTSSNEIIFGSIVVATRASRQSFLPQFVESSVSLSRDPRSKRGVRSRNRDFLKKYFSQ